LVAGVGFESAKNQGDKCTQSIQNRANSKQDSALETQAEQAVEHTHAPSIHAEDTFKQPKCVPDVYRNLPDDLAQVVAAWNYLPDDVKGQILTLIEDAGPLEGL